MALPMLYDKTDPKNLILRDYLALDRTMLANERTLLAYLRTAIMLFISGITIIKLFEQVLAMVVLGYTLLPLSLITAVFGYVRFHKVNKIIKTSNEET